MSDQVQQGVEAPKKVQIKKSVLTAQIEAGMKKVDLMAHYGLKEAQMTKVLQAAGLRIRKFHNPVFELEDDTEEETEEAVDAVQEVVAQEAATEEVVTEDNTAGDIASNMEVEATAEVPSTEWK